MKTRSYILVTPAKNEEKNLPLLAKSVVNQSIRPRLWVIVNDNSTDKTPEIIEKLESEYDWVVGYTMEDSFEEYDPTMRYSEVVRSGFSVALKLANNRGIPYGYIGLVDADFILERKFFEKLIMEFHENPSLGIASGGVYLKSPDGKRIFWEKTNPKHPRGSPRLFRRECFDDIGGYRRFYAPDVISNYLARIKGWRVAQIVDAIGVQLRATQERYGYYRSSIKRGHVNCYLGTPFLSVLLWVLYMGLTDSLIKASGFLRGYFEKKFNNDCNVLDNRWIVEFAKDDLSIKSNIIKVLQQREVKWGQGQFRS